MSSEDWRTASFRDLIANGVLLIGDGYRAKNSELGGEGPIFLRAGHVRNTHIEFDAADHFVAELTPKLKAKMSRAGDVVVTTKGNSTGRVTFVSGEMPPFIYSPHLSYWRSLDHHALHPGFLRYWSRSREFRTQLAGFAAQTDMAPFISLRDQQRLQITLPPPSVQQSIAVTLGALDDKIELNRRMNRTLESIARAIFKSWFVDFDPVRQKMEGGEVGLPPDLAALFPASFSESRLGPIPTGWDVAAIGDVVAVIGGSTPSTKEPAYWGGEIAFATPRDMAQLTAPALRATERRVTPEGAATISSGLLPPGAVLMSSRAPIGYLAITEIPVCVNQGFIAMLAESALPALYVLNWARENMETIVASANGTTFLEISKRSFRPLLIAVPPDEVLNTFVDVATSLHRRVVSGLDENDLLCATRDRLLSALLRGHRGTQELPHD